MYRFLLQPRWIAGHVLVVVTVIAFVNLGLWQVSRLEERQAANSLIVERLDVAPVAFDEAGGDPDALAFRRIDLTGRYLADAQWLTTPRAIDGRPGQHVLAVLARDDGPDVLIDRGWVPFDRARTAAPSAPTGQVRVRGIVRAPEPGGIGDADVVAQIAPSQLSGRLGRALAPYYVQLRAQQPPPPPDAPVPSPLPELTEGSHRAYAVQWFSFALIALIGYPVLVWRTARTTHTGPDTDPTDASRRDVTVSSTRSG